MEFKDFFRETGFAVTVCDLKGIVVYMNAKAGKVFEKYGGLSLVGKSLFDCHSEKSRTKILELIDSASSNSYTIEKAGLKKLIHQTPWYQDGKIAGLVELSIELPADMAHFVRTP